MQRSAVQPWVGRVWDTLCHPPGWARRRPIGPAVEVDLRRWILSGTALVACGSAPPHFDHLPPGQRARLCGPRDVAIGTITAAEDLGTQLTGSFAHGLPRARHDARVALRVERWVHRADGSAGPATWTVDLPISAWDTDNDGYTDILPVERPQELRWREPGGVERREVFPAPPNPRPGTRVLVSVEPGESGEPSRVWGWFASPAPQRSEAALAAERDALCASPPRLLRLSRPVP
jgi:hypothetical protein